MTSGRDVGREQILDQQITVLTVKRDIFVGNHLD